MTRWQRGSWYEYIYVYLDGIKRWNFKYGMYIWQSVILKLLLMLDCKIVLEHTSRTSLMSWRRINGSNLVCLCVREHVWLFILSVLRLISLNGDWESVLKRIWLCISITIDQKSFLKFVFCWKCYRTNKKRRHFSLK